MIEEDIHEIRKAARKRLDAQATILRAILLHLGALPQAETTLTTVSASTPGTWKRLR